MPRPFTLDDADQLADALMPRFQQAMQPQINQLRAEINAVTTEITTLKGKSTMWGALGGIFSAAVTALAAIATHR